MFSFVVTKLRAPVAVDVKAIGTNRLNPELQWGVSVIRYLLEEESPHGQVTGSQGCKGKRETEEDFFQTAVGVQNQAERSPRQSSKT